MIATAVLIMLAGRLTNLAELNISHVPCVQGDFRAVYSGSCSTNCVGSVPPTCVYIGRVLQPTKILFILPLSKPCAYTWSIDAERVEIDDRRIATDVLYERMKHMARLSFGNMWTFTLGFQHTARQQENADRLCGKDGTTGIIGANDEPYKT